LSEIRQNNDRTGCGPDTFGMQPVMKLREQVRKGGKLHRVDDEAKAPYQRPKESGVLNRKQQAGLDGRYSLCQSGFSEPEQVAELDEELASRGRA
jgi:hypothetical protein